MLSVGAVKCHKQSGEWQLKHSFSEACVRYVGVAGTRGGRPPGQRKGLLGRWWEPSCIWLLTLSREETMSQSCGGPSAGEPEAEPA